MKRSFRPDTIETVPDAVATRESPSVLAPALMLTMYVPWGIPVPKIAVPAVKPAVDDRPETVVELAVVVPVNVVMDVAVSGIAIGGRLCWLGYG